MTSDEYAEKLKEIYTQYDADLADAEIDREHKIYAAKARRDGRIIEAATQAARPFVREVMKAWPQKAREGHWTWRAHDARERWTGQFVEDEYVIVFCTDKLQMQLDKCLMNPGDYFTSY